MYKGDAVFRLDLFLMCRQEQEEMVDSIMETMEMVETLEMVEQSVLQKRRLHRHNRGSQHLIWESSPRTLHSSMGV